MMVVFSIFFARLAGVPSDGAPYPIFVYAALIPWTFFSYALNHSSNSLVVSAALLRRVYFPRLIMPLASVMAGLFDFALAFLILIALMLYYGIYPTIAIVVLPLLLLLAFGSALSVGIWLSAVNVAYRDVRYTIPFLTQIWLLVTPIAYPSSLLGEPWQSIYGLNPMAGVVDGFRWALLGSDPPGQMIAVSVGTTLLLLGSGLYYFRQMERTFADIV